MTPQHPADCDALRKEGRRLASQRDDLIAQGVDPDALEVPLAPHRCPDCSAPRVDGVFGEGPQHPAAPEGETDASGIETLAARLYLADRRNGGAPDSWSMLSDNRRAPYRTMAYAARDALRERLRVVEGERDAAVRERNYARRQRDEERAAKEGNWRALGEWSARAESAEAAHAALVAGVEALAADFDTAVGFRGAATSLRALLAGGGA